MVEILLNTLSLRKAQDKEAQYLPLGILFLCIKDNKNIKGLNIFNHIFSYTAYPDDTTLFSKR